MKPNWVGLALVLVFAIVGCGGEDSTAGGNAGTATTSVSGSGDDASPEELVRVATLHFEAFLDRDDEAYYEQLSRACRDRLGFSAVVGHLDGRHFTVGLDGVDVSALSVSDVVVEGGDDGASVSLIIDGQGGDRFRETLPHRWIQEEGGWRMDDCADFREAQGGLEGQGMDRSQPLPLGGVADVNHWLVALIDVTPNGEDLIVELGGEPASDGNQLFTAQLNLGYNGAEPSVVVGDELAVAMVNGDTVYGDESDCPTEDTSIRLDPAAEVGPGETVGNPIICREISVDHVTGLLLRITHLPTGGEWWFSLDGS